MFLFFIFLLCFMRINVFIIVIISYCNFVSFFTSRPTTAFYSRFFSPNCLKVSQPVVPSCCSPACSAGRQSMQSFLSSRTICCLRRRAQHTDVHSRLSGRTMPSERSAVRHSRSFVEPR